MAASFRGLPRNVEGTACCSNASDRASASLALAITSTSDDTREEGTSNSLLLDKSDTGCSLILQAGAQSASQPPTPTGRALAGDESTFLPKRLAVKPTGVPVVAAAPSGKQVRTALFPRDLLKYLILAG